MIFTRAASKFLFLPIFVLLFLFFAQTAQADTANVALNKPVTASSYIAGEDMRMIDDGLMSYGAVGIPDGQQWVKIDLQNTYSISSLVLRHWWSDGFFIKYHDVAVQFSEDGTNWKTVFNNDTDNTLGFGAGADSEYLESADGKTITLSAPVTARYVRAWSNGSTENTHNVYQEFQAIGIPVLAPNPTPTPTPTPAPTPVVAPSVPANVALNEPVTASSYIAGEDMRMIDDGLMSYGAVGIPEGPQWVQIDLQNDYLISSLILRHWWSDGFSISYHDVVVQLSEDGTNWKTVFNNDTGNTLGFGAGSDSEYLENADGRTIALPTPVRAHYVRAWSNGNTDNPRNTYQEFEAIGIPAPASTPTPTPAPTVTVLPTAPTSCGSVAIGGQNFERIPIKFYATYMNGREEVIYAPGTNTPAEYWEISQDEFINISKQRYVDYVGGTTLYQQTLQQNLAVLQPTPCSNYVWKDGVQWMISSVLQEYQLANDPTMCLVGGTASAPLYMPCISPGYQQYLQQQLSNSPPAIPDVVPISLSTDDWNKVIQILKDNQASIPNLPMPTPNPIKKSDDVQQAYRVTLYDNYQNGLLTVSSVNLGNGKFSLNIQNNIPFWVALKVRNALTTGISIQPRNSTLDKFGLIPPSGAVSYDVDFGLSGGQLAITGTLDDQAMIMNFGVKMLLKLTGPLGDMVDIANEGVLVLLSVPDFKGAVSDLANAYQSFKDRQIGEVIHSVKDFMYDLGKLLNTPDNRGLLAAKLVELGKIQESQIPDVILKLQNIGKGSKVWDLFNALVGEAKFLGIAIAGQDRASFSFGAVPAN